MELKRQKTKQGDFRKRFGEPMAIYTSQAVKWLVYSRSPSSTHYRKRMIAIDQQERVCEKTDVANPAANLKRVATAKIEKIQAIHEAHKATEYLSRAF